MTKRMKCSACGGRMVRDVRSDTVEYKGATVTVQQPGWYCTSCDEVVLAGEDAGVTEAAFVRLRAKVDDILTPAEIRRIRERLGISQRTAGKLLGGGPRSFQKYESGTDWVTRAMANLLRLLDNDPERLRELSPAARRSPSRSSGQPALTPDPR